MLWLLKAHISDISHQVILILVKHDLVILVVVVPCIWISWVLLRQHKDQVFLLKASVLLWIRYNVLNWSLRLIRITLVVMRVQTSAAA